MTRSVMALCASGFSGFPATRVSFCFFFGGSCDVWPVPNARAAGESRDPFSSQYPHFPLLYQSDHGISADANPSV